jgi:mono/diheme cytochrome c family protein
MRRQLLPLGVVLAWAAPDGALAADPDQGVRLARRVCSICHNIGTGRNSPDVNAPPFSRIARSAKFRARGAAFMLEPHRRMPLFALTVEQGEDLAAYIRILARR